MSYRAAAEGAYFPVQVAEGAIYLSCGGGRVSLSTWLVGPGCHVGVLRGLHFPWVAISLGMVLQTDLSLWGAICLGLAMQGSEVLGGLLRCAVGC